MENQSNFYKNKVNKDELNFIYLLNLFLRNKISIISFSLIFIFLTSFYSVFFRKRIWEGKFEIVLDSQMNSPVNNLEGLGGLTALTGFDPKGALQTEVGILKSPSVLLPVFNFVKKQYKLNFPRKEELTFLDWRKENLNIKLKKNTSILEISYFDKDQTVIIPVLNKISTAYQEYSGRNKRRNFQLARNYLTEQISVYKLKSADSLKLAQEYAMNQDLLTVEKSLGNSLSLSNFENIIAPQFLNSNTGIEEIRVKAANQIRRINIQIEKIQEIKNDEKKLQYIGSTIPGLANTGLPKNLESIESSLANLRSKYTDDDLSIKRLIEKRKLLIGLLKERAIGYLEASLIEQKTIMESATRPKGVILKYKELMRESGRDEATLVKLENNLRELNLEEARLEDPWELINVPTLNDSPEGLSHLKLAILSGIIGFISSYLFAFLRENKSGYLYEDKLISEEFNAEIIEKINITNGNFSYNDIDILSKEIFKENKSNDLSFIVAGHLEEKCINTLEKLFKSVKDFYIEKDYSLIESTSKIIIFVSVGEVTKDQIYRTLNRLHIQGKKIYRLILLEK